VRALTPQDQCAGGGIANGSTGTLNLINCTLSGNSVSGGVQSLGGGIYHNDSGTLNITNCTLSDNSASSSSPGPRGSGSSGGGIFNNGSGTVNVVNSTLARNSANGVGQVGSGGGILNNNMGTVNVTNSTLVGNTAIGTNGFGGAINSGGPGPVTVTNSTLSGNSAIGNTSAVGTAFGGGIYRGAGPVTVKNTIIAGNTATGGTVNRGPDVYESSSSNKFVSQGYNLIGTSDARFGSGFRDGDNHDQVGTLDTPLDPMLAPGLGSNDGPTQTIALLPGSPAIDHGSETHDPATGDPITTDQRGFVRPTDDPNTSDEPGGNGSDIGAFEYLPRQAPVARCRNLTVSAGPTCTANASIDNNSYDPDVEDTITLAQSPAGPYALGATNVTLTVTDNHGAASSCVGTVTVADTTAPAITCPAALMANGSLASGGATVLFTVSAADACDASLSLGTSRPSGSLFPFGTTTVLATATDDGGNSASCSFAVTVLTPQSQFASLIAQINALVTGGALAPNKANPLITKLDQVVNKLDRGQTNAACGQLGAFLNQANAYIGNGTLTVSQGQALISATNAIKASIGC
jgi:hypothetical protein